MFSVPEVAFSYCGVVKMRTPKNNKKKIKKIEMGNGKRPITNRFVMD